MYRGMTNTTTAFETFITPTAHEKREWARMAQAAYKAGRSCLGHRMSGAACLASDQSMGIQRYDHIMGLYRTWLIDGFAAIPPLR